jgi:hypothetical protein
MPFLFGAWKTAGGLGGMVQFYIDKVRKIYHIEHSFINDLMAM